MMNITYPVAASTNWEILQGRLNGTLPAAGSVFDKTPTPGIIAFEVVVVLGFLAALVILSRLVKRVPLRFLIMACGVLIFELFTGPMWRNLKMGNWAYFYQQVSWILMLGWSTLILSIIIFVDHWVPKKRELVRFAIYLAILTPVTLAFEVLLVALGLRHYSPEVMQTVCGIQFFGVPIEALYYVPVFLSLIIGFYKYWSFVINEVPVVPLARIPWFRTLWITALSVLVFELMIEPMVNNQGFPKWSYFYRDLTFILTGGWVVAVWLSTNLVDRFLPHWSLAHRFLAYMGVMAVLAVPVEGWLIQNGYRIYGPSAVANFSRLTLPGTHIPIEVCFAIPLYFALVIGLIRYVEISITNRETLYVR